MSWWLRTTSSHAGSAAEDRSESARPLRAKRDGPAQRLVNDGEDALLVVGQATAERHYTADDVRLLRAESKARKRAALQRPVVYCSCPACGNQMLRRTFGEMSFLLVHYCAAHGFWIHREELEGIASYVSRGGEILEMANVTEKLEERLRWMESKIGERADSGGVSFIPGIFPF